MAGLVFIRLVSRTALLSTGRTYCSVKTTAWGDSNHAQKQNFRISVYLSRKSFSTVSQLTKPLMESQYSQSSRYLMLMMINMPAFSSTIHCRLLSYTCYRRTSQTNNANNCSYNLDTKVNLKECDSDTKKQIDDPETKAILQDISADFKNEFTEVKHETTGDEEELGQKINSSLDSIVESKNDTDFEYDYQVAEDIEEYDYIDEKILAEQQVRPEKTLPISLERGKTGVFDLDELVILLEDLGAENIVAVPVPPEANFCDHMVVVSAKSLRHVQAINEELLWVHKRKKSKNDPHLVIEGLNKSAWCAMDIGNIVLHVFYGDKREYYDIESLWTLGRDNDPKCQEQSVDPYALSPEDLFWLETKDTADNVTETANQDDKDTTDSDESASEASMKPKD